MTFKTRLEATQSLIEEKFFRTKGTTFVRGEQYAYVRPVWGEYEIVYFPPNPQMKSIAEIKQDGSAWK